MEKLNMQWDIIMSLNFYDFQNILESYTRILDERKQAEEDEMKKQGYDEKKYNPVSIPTLFAASRFFSNAESR
jgi:hypothetical protein